MAIWYVPPSGNRSSFPLTRFGPMAGAGSNQPSGPRARSAARHSSSPALPRVVGGEELVDVVRRETTGAQPLLVLAGRERHEAGDAVDHEMAHPVRAHGRTARQQRQGAGGLLGGHLVQRADLVVGAVAGGGLPRPRAVEGLGVVEAVVEGARVDVGAPTRSVGAGWPAGRGAGRPGEQPGTGGADQRSGPGHAGQERAAVEVEVAVVASHVSPRGRSSGARAVGGTSADRSLPRSPLPCSRRERSPRKVSARL